MITLVACFLVCLQEGILRREAPERGAAEREFPPATELRIHDAARVTGHAGLAGLEADLARLAPGTPPLRACEALERVAARRDEVESVTQGLIETLRDRMEPRLGSEQRLDSLHDGQLVLLGLPEQHVWLDAFLAEADAFEGLIDVHARVYEVARGVLPESLRGSSGRALDVRTGNELVRLLAEKGVESTLAPRVVVFPFQKASLAMVEQIPYVSDFEIEVLPDQGAEIADPVVVVAEDGVNLDVRAMAAAHGRLAVYARLDCARVARPIPDAELALTVGGTVTVQHPEITHLKVEGRFELGPDEYLMLLAPSEPDVLVLLQATRIPAQSPAGR